ncbi:alpha/beta hydrolase domain-containing protein [Sphingomonas solaris]|uniref:alpha/beta hydrolase domain-containing protein n=1 Tax=Alterirhizorhabdus solaris TaxID=2529389 RepID=UPI0013967EAA|nr:alpha/beta hydrolase domain-containing protein [Sphingomonas solaris]
MRKRATIAAGLAFGLTGMAGSAGARPAAVMERLEVVEDRIAFDGRSFGTVGPYRLIRARAHMRVAPEATANRRIVDLDKAPRTPAGDVRYWADVVIFRPVSPAHARRVMIAEVPNRGIRLADSMLNTAPVWVMPPGFGGGADARKPASAPADAGSGFAFRRGYTLVAVGWQGDLPAQPAVLLRAHLPVATDGGRPITGRVQAVTVFDTPETQSTMALAYPVAPGTEGDGVLTVRALAGTPPRTLDRTAWRLLDATHVRIDRPAGMDAGAIYEFVYTAQDPVVAGLGFAATRDVVSFLRHDAADEAGGANPLIDLRDAPCALAKGCAATRTDTVDTVLGFGVSQSGRYLRDMIGQGFNADTAGRPVLDGAFVLIAGSRKTFTNRRWAEPGRFSRQHEDPLVPGNQFPFAYGSATDPLTGRKDGILSGCAGQACPKIVHVDGSSEFWNAGGVLVGSDGAGHDVAFPANVRGYMIASAPHAPFITMGAAALPPSPLTTGGVVRALLVALDDWVAGAAEPPPSRWPSIAKGDLADPASRTAVGFPDYSGLPYYGRANPVAPTNYDTVPPTVDPRRAWTIMVPVTDADGNDRVGIRMPDVAVPRGTYLGWNPRKPGYAEGDIALVFGSFVPFAATAEAARAAGDPRRPLAERYRDEADYKARLAAATAALKRERLWLADSD